MASIEPLGLSANQWQFLCDGGVQRYVDASGGKLLLVLAAAGEGAILAGQTEPHREWPMAVSGDLVAW